MAMKSKSLTKLDKSDVSAQGVILFEYEIDAPLDQVVGKGPLSELFNGLLNELGMELIDVKLRIMRRKDEMVVESLVVKGFS